MILFLGVARALKAMHQYKVKGAPGGPTALNKARAIRREGAEADEDASRQAKRKRDRSDREEGDIENQPLMGNEVTRSQEGVDDGELRAYAHRDIKPGEPSRCRSAWAITKGVKDENLKLKLP